MNTRDISLICELANYKSFSDASFSLPYSASAITKYVSNVEEGLGIKLFIRSNKSHSLVLTPEGTEIIAAMRSVNGEYKHLLNIVSRMKNQSQNTIRIGSQPRFGNLHEQKIISEFIINNSKASVSMQKASTTVLIKLMLSGEIDAAFITLHTDIDAAGYFGADAEKLNINFVASEINMYLGIAEKYLQGKTAAKLSDFQGFTFAFPFLESTDPQDVKALSSWLDMFRAQNIDPKYMCLEGYDNTIFQLASLKPIAVTTTNVPARHDGIKFVRLKDWIGCTKLYFIYPKSNRSPMLKNLQKGVTQYTRDLAAIVAE